MAAVVPARAGIFLISFRIVDGRLRRPRTRGDLPTPATPHWPTPTSSPHARGSSVVQVAGRGGHDVVPARAGIFPLVARQRRQPGGRPRTRGDLPSPSSWRRRPLPSSPHARGSSRHPVDRHGRCGVVPARAGIFRGRGPGRCAPGCRPRTRGDLPANIPPRARATTSSPHARGSSEQGEDHEGG